ncbi:MAG: nucleoside deaminase [Actinomycetota bacterium]
MAAMALIDSSFRSLPEPMQQAVSLAFQAADHGSLAIAATVARNGHVIATGRNRLFEDDSGEDHIAGTSLAHAEINALAKLRYRAHESDELELYTTLQPCLQCLGAIRLAPISRVIVLAPDPLWAGLATIRDVTPFVAARWPHITTVPASEWSVLSLLSPTRHALAHPRLTEIWRHALPATSELARRVDPADLEGDSPPARAAHVWSDLGACVSEVDELAAGDRQDAVEPRA